MESDFKTIYNPEDVARILNISLTTVYGLLRKGILPGRKVGHQWKILDTDLRNFLSPTGGQ